LKPVSHYPPGFAAYAEISWLAGASVIRGRRGLICPRRAKKGRKSIQPIRDPFA